MTTSTSLQTLTDKLAKRFEIGDGSDLVNTLKQTAFKGEVSNSQMTALLIIANQYGLNPWLKEIYAFPDKNNGIVPIVGVDGWMRIMNENENFDGIEFDIDDEKCTCKIYRKDRAKPISVTEYMSECYREAHKGVSKSGQPYEIKSPWQTHPKRMLRHKAMIQCARLAFGFGGIYDQDEAERIVESQKEPINVTPKSNIINTTAEEVPMINAEQVETLEKLIELTGTVESKVLAAYGADGISSLTAKQADNAIDVLKKRFNKQQEEALANESGGGEDIPL